MIDSIGTLGASVDIRVGATDKVTTAVDVDDGDDVGFPLGINVPDELIVAVALGVVIGVAIPVTATVGADDGDDVGMLVGTGLNVAFDVGMNDGLDVGLLVGDTEGFDAGEYVGFHLVLHLAWM